MAATADKYYNNGISKRSAKIVAVTQHDIPMALMLAEYGTVANIKALFYLDYVRRMAKKDANGNVVYVFIGLCKVGSANYNMHAEARRSRRRMSRTLDGVTREDYVWFNDGGLNTKGKATNLAPASDQGVLSVKSGSITFKSAYFTTSSKYGVRYRTALEAWQEVAETNLPAGNTGSGSTVTRNYSLTNARANTSMEVYGFIENPEGEYQTAPFTILVLAEAVEFRYSSNEPNGGTLGTYYMGQPLQVGSTIYNEATLQFASAGFYTYNNNVYRQEVVGSTLQITTISPVAISPTVQTFSYRKYDSAKSNACAWPELESDKSMYYRVENGLRRYYTTSSMTTLVANGYYSYPNGSGGYDVLSIVNGYELDILTC